MVKGWERELADGLKYQEAISEYNADVQDKLEESLMLSEITWNLPMIATVMGCAIPIAAIVGAAWYKIASVTSENDLKRSMVQRGMSVDEIDRVLAARSYRNK